MKYSLPSRRLILAGLLASAATVSLANAPERSIRAKPRPGGSAPRRVAPSPQSLIEAAQLGGKVGFVVADARTGQLLESVNGNVPLPPASVAKAVTALYALDALGPSFRFNTRVIAEGGMSGGVVAGDLMVVGGGDPTLSTDHLAELAAQLKAAGLREVRGSLRAYSGALPYVKTIDPEQPDHVGYSPAVSGLNLNFNRVHFEWKRSGNGYDVTMDARSEKYRPRVAFARMEIAERAAPVYTYRSKGNSDFWTVSRGALGKGGARWLPVRKPATYCLEVLAGFLRSQGIAVKLGPDLSRPPSGTEIGRHASQPLSRVVADMLKFSTNVTAEAVGLTATAARKGKAASLKASGRDMSSWLKGAGGAQKASFADHSGLSDASRVSADDMVAALVRLGPKSGLRPLLKSIPMRDSKGRRIEGSKIEIMAKTGTLNFVSGLGGYFRLPDGRELAFAIFMGDTKRRAAIKRADREGPVGAKSWNKRAKNLQMQLIDRWSKLYPS